jgi:hypothetical protein
MWIGTDDIGCCHDQFKYYVDWKRCDRKVSRPIWSTIWIWKDDKWWCDDLIWGAM